MVEFTTDDVRSVVDEQPASRHADAEPTRVDAGRPESHSLLVAVPAPGGELRANADLHQVVRQMFTAEVRTPNGVQPSPAFVAALVDKLFEGDAAFSCRRPDETA